MAEKLPEGDGPFFELPSLFGRRKKRTPEPAAPVAPEEPRERRELRLPAWAASTAALVVGAAVGVLGCALTRAGLQGCEVVTGTDSCGGPGLLVVVLILVAIVVAGAAALKPFGVQDAANLSLLGVGLLTAVVLIFLTDHLDERWMIIGIPVLTALCFWVAHWVTTRYVDEADLEPARQAERHDIR